MKIKFVVLLVLLSGFKSATQLNAQRLTSGLMAHYLFNGDVNDNGRYDNHGLMRGGLEFVEDRFGNECGALNFNGTDGFVVVPHSNSLNSPKQELSVAVWFKMDKGSGDIKWLTVCCKSDIQDELPESPHFRFQTTNQTISINTDFTENFVKDVEFDVWHHYAISYDGKYVRAYFDGVRFFEFPYTKTFNKNTMPMEIGRDMPGGIEYFSGVLDDLRIYNRGLSDKEIMKIYQDQSEKNSVKPCPQNQASVTPPPTPPTPTPTPTPTPAPPTTTTTTTTTTTVKNPPVVIITRPIPSPYTTSQPEELLTAKLENVKNKRDIKFEVNGVEIKQFSYDKKTGILESTVSLNPGYNQCKITASNKDGTDDDSIIINYEKIAPPPPPPPAAVVLNPPVVNIISPRSPATSNTAKSNVVATIKNITKKEEIQFKVNGVINNDFTFDARTNTFESTIDLDPGNNSIEIIAENKDGKDFDTGTIKLLYNPQPPIVTILTPDVSPHTSDNADQVIRAKIEHVDNKSDVSFSLNAVPNQNFTFDPTTQIFEAKIQLEQGRNFFEITGTNPDGTDKDNGLVEYELEDLVITKPDLGVVEINYEVVVPSEKVTLVCFDHKRIDGDIVSIVINDQVVAEKITLKAKGRGAFKTALQLEPNKNYTLVSKAWNTGGSPPNTMTIEFYDGNSLIKTIELNSDIGKSEGVNIIYRQ